MIACEELSDAMPELAAGRRDWTDEERRHLAACRDCAREWRVISSVRGLGDEVATTIDPERISAAVLSRLSRERRTVRLRRRWLTGFAAAACLTLLVWQGTGRPRHPAPAVGGSPEATTGFALPMAELDSLDSSQLQSVLEDLDQPFGASTSPSVPALGELNDLELERVLRSLEG
jgi:hypothetical protein